MRAGVKRAPGEHQNRWFAVSAQFSFDVVLQRRRGKKKKDSVPDCGAIVNYLFTG